MKHLYIMAGCNGAGKTSFSHIVLKPVLSVHEFINADAIAASLSPGEPEKMAFRAGRMMLERIDRLLDQGLDFAFETTLSARSYTVIIKKAKKMGYKIHLFFLWLPSAAMAIKRVKERVAKGGHYIPDEIVKRRYQWGINNFFRIYCHLCHSFEIIDSSSIKLKKIALQELEAVCQIVSPAKWMPMQQYLSEPIVSFVNRFQADLMDRIIEVHYKYMLEETIRSKATRVVADDNGNIYYQDANDARRLYREAYGVDFEE